MNKKELFEYKPSSIDFMKQFLLDNDSDCTLTLEYNEVSILFMYIESLEKIIEIIEKK